MKKTILMAALLIVATAALLPASLAYPYYNQYSGYMGANWYNPYWGMSNYAGYNAYMSNRYSWYDSQWSNSCVGRYCRPWYSGFYNFY